MFLSSAGTFLPALSSMAPPTALSCAVQSSWCWRSSGKSVICLRGECQDAMWIADTVVLQKERGCECNYMISDCFWSWGEDVSLFQQKNSSWPFRSVLGDGVSRAELWLQMILHLPIFFFFFEFHWNKQASKQSNSELIASGTRVAGCLATSGTWDESLLKECCDSSLAVLRVPGCKFW